LIFLGLALIFSVEFAFLRDNFAARMNTVFKFYFQGWILLGIASAFGIFWLFNHGRDALRPAVRAVFLACAALLIAAGMVYPVLAYTNRANGFTGTPNLDATSDLASRNPDDFAAINWLKNQAEPGQPAPVILEAPGNRYQSYVYEGRISAFTGFSAVLGWAGHESQWRGTYNEQAVREADISLIYTAGEPDQVLDLLHKYGVRYVVMGGPERRYVEKECSESGRSCSLPRAERNLNALLPVLFQSGQTIVYGVPET
jgi:uncharacterized membrane protein